MTGRRYCEVCGEGSGLVPWGAEDCTSHCRQCSRGHCHTAAGVADSFENFICGKGKTVVQEEGETTQGWEGKLSLGLEELLLSVTNFLGPTTRPGGPPGRASRGWGSDCTAVVAPNALREGLGPRVTLAHCL